MRRYILFVFMLSCLQTFAQKKNTSASVLEYDTSILAQLQFREIGPWRGGRSAAVVGDLENKQLFYFGATGGGVWKSADGGSNWKNISDGYFGGSIGSIAISKSDPTIIYVGGGENSIRGNVSSGDGMWRTENAGRTWQHVGLENTKHIFRTVVHPKDPNTVYCAAQGNIFSHSVDRGIYKTENGGKSWEKILYLNDSVGACELIIDPTNPDILLATFWNVKRTPYSLESGGVGSGIWKSTDAGNTWKDITQNTGLPKETLGIIGINISPANPDKYIAIIEAKKEGGVYVSNDAGNTWNKTNSDNNLRQRAWYYSKIFADPKSENTMYVLNVEFWKSIDGGKTFTSIRTPHVDHHDLWIDPNDPERMIIGDDGGAQVTYDGGKNWSTYYNQPTAQIYRVSTDNHIPYRILGAQQDNTSVRIFHRSLDGQIDRNDWEPTAGFESGTIVSDPKNPDIVYGGNYSGFIGTLNHETGDRRNITVWPDEPIGQGADIQKYRFQWNFPLFFSPHDSSKLYAAGNVLFYTIDKGTTWNIISPDLTTNDKSKQIPSGGMITKDNTGVEVYCTIFAAAESPLEKDVIYTGSDDGLLHLTKNGGVDWENITPPDLPEWTMINCIEVDPITKGKMYFAATKYKVGDDAPYLYVTEDYGKSWKKIVKGIDATDFTRVIRADINRSGLLYCGTEHGLYISYNDGVQWNKFQNNLPLVPITDITIKNNDLIIATQGRGFWILDDLSIVQKMDKNIATNNLLVYPIRDTYLQEGYQIEKPQNAGKNPASGVAINYYINIEPDTSNQVSITIKDKLDSVIQTYSSNASEKDKKLIAHKGINQFAWNMQYPDAIKIEGMFLWNDSPSGPKAAPGNYTAQIVFGKDTINNAFTIVKDPNSTATAEDYVLQFEFQQRVIEKFNEVQNAIISLRASRTQINNFMKQIDKEDADSIKPLADTIINRLTRIEETLNETRNKSAQDMLNYGIKLNDKLAGLYYAAAQGNYRPTNQVLNVFDTLSSLIDAELNALKEVQTTDIPLLNEKIHALKLPVIQEK
ncbi:MAG: hypothetical protein WAT52_06215 [Chitinophagales bacterium]